MGPNILCFRDVAKYVDRCWTEQIIFGLETCVAFDHRWSSLLIIYLSCFGYQWLPFAAPRPLVLLVSPTSGSLPFLRSRQTCSTCQTSVWWFHTFLFKIPMPDDPNVHGWSCDANQQVLSQCRDMCMMQHNLCMVLSITHMYDVYTYVVTQTHTHTHTHFVQQMSSARSTPCATRPSIHGYLCVSSEAVPSFPSSFNVPFKGDQHLPCLCHGYDSGWDVQAVFVV